MSTIRRKINMTSLVLMVATMSATVAVALLFTTTEDHTNKFWLSLASLLFAESLTFLYPSMLMQRGKQAERNIPLHIATNLYIWIYDAGVIVLSLVALTPITFSFLLSLHILLLLVLVLGVGGSTMASIFFGGMDAKDSIERSPMIVFTNRCVGVCDRLTMIEIAAVSVLAKDFSVFIDEELRFAANESLAGSEQSDKELNDCLYIIEGHLEDIEEIPDSEITAENIEDNPLQETVATLVAASERQLKVLRQLLQRREGLISELRRQ